MIERYAYLTPKHKEMFSKVKFRNRWNYLLINEVISLYFDFVKYPDINQK